MKKITELTQDQLDSIPTYINKYINMITRPINHEEFQSAIIEFYSQLKLSTPEFKIFPSPWQCKLYQMELLGLKKLDSYHWVNVWWLVRSAWFAFAKSIGVELDSAQLELFRKFAENSFFAIPYDTIFIYSEKPIFVNWENGLLSNRSGPSIKFSDGHCLWNINGVEVTEKIVMFPETITLDEIRKESNAELRRIMIQQFGVGKYFFESKSKVLDMDTLTLEGSAARALMEDESGEKWLVGSDESTQRIYNMPVPREAKTCRESHNLICGFDESRLIAEA